MYTIQFSYIISKKGTLYPQDDFEKGFHTQIYKNKITNTNVI